MTTEKTLQQLSIDHLNNDIKSLAENTRLTNIAKTVNDKNKLLRLVMQKQELEVSIAYHRTKIKIGE